MLYPLVKQIIRITLWFFYRKIQVNGREYIIRKGPLLIAANHPNTLMDPLVVSCFMPQRLGFIAKATLFANGLIKWFFRQLHMIPVRRRVDGTGPEALRENQKAFQKCYDYLHHKGSILIFPEGNSYHEMRLRPLKTGVSRIALEFEALHGFTRGTQLLPVALNYSEPSMFRKDLVLNFAPAIHLSDYKTLYEQDPGEAVKALTEELRRRLESQMVIAAHPEQEVLYKKIQSLYRKYLEKELSTTTDAESQFKLSREIGQAMMYFEASDPSLYEQITSKIDRYVRLTEYLNLHERTIGEKGTKVSVATRLFIAVYGLLGLPFYLAGLLTNYLPYQIPARLARLITREPEYRASIMMLGGLLVFPGFYALEVSMFRWWVSREVYWSIGITLALPLLGFFTLHYYQFMSWAASKVFVVHVLKKKENIYTRLAADREEILKLLEEARLKYQEVLESQSMK